MLSRTGQRCHYPVLAVVEAPHAEDSHDRKRLRAEGCGAVHVDGVGVCCLTVMFSSVCAPALVDFVITSRGVQTVADDDDLGIVTAPVPSPPSVTTVTAAPAVADALTVGVARPPLAEVSPLDVGSVAGDFQPSRPGDIPVGEAEGDEDAYFGKWTIFRSQAIVSISFRHRIHHNPLVFCVLVDAHTIDF